MAFHPKVLVAEKNKELHWAGRLFFDGFFRGEHYFKLKKVDETTTRFIHGEIFSGLCASLMLKMMKNETEQGFVLMNEALAKLQFYSKFTLVVSFYFDKYK